MNAPVWRRSTKCESSACVEVATTGAEVLVRDSKNPDSPILQFGAEEWKELVDGTRGGEFDDDDGEWFSLRDGKTEDGPVLQFTRAEWQAFTAGVRVGDFDYLNRT